MKDAVVKNYISNVTNINAENVNIFTQKDFVIESGVLKAYKGESPNVVIPRTVKRIGEEAFKDLMIETVEIPDTVIEINSHAFEGCRDLTAIVIPDSVTSIGSYAFSNCTSLTSVKIPDSVTSIGDGAFMGCWSLTSVTIPDSVTSIGSYAFSNCTSLTSVKIPDSVTTIGSGAFLYCSSLKRVHFNKWIHGFGSAFDNTFFINACKQQNRCPSCGSTTGFSRLSGKCKNCGKQPSWLK